MGTAITNLPQTFVTLGRDSLPVLVSAFEERDSLRKTLALDATSWFILSGPERSRPQRDRLVSLIYRIVLQL